MNRALKKDMIEVARYRVKYRNKFDQKALYYLMHEWLVQEEWESRKDSAFKETFIGHSEANAGGDETWWCWRPEKVINNYFKWQMSINAHTVFLKKDEVMHKGKKFKVHFGEVEVLIHAWILTDQKGDWKKHSILKHFNKIYKDRIMGDNIEKQKKALKGEAYRLQEAIKDFLELEKIKEEPEGQGDFFPIRGIGE